ncbi:hypothetical protein Esti_003052 [Eimeria stiedai]
MGGPQAVKQPPPPPVILRLGASARSGQGLWERTGPNSNERGPSPPYQGQRAIRLYNRYCRIYKRAQGQRHTSSGEGSGGPPETPLILRRPQGRSGLSTSAERGTSFPFPPPRYWNHPSAEGRYPFPENSQRAYLASVAHRGPLGCARNPPLPYKNQGPPHSSWHEGNIRSRLAFYGGSWGEAAPSRREATFDRASHHLPTSACKAAPSPPPRTSRLRCEQHDERRPSLDATFETGLSPSPSRGGFWQLSQESGAAFANAESGDGDLSKDSSSGNVSSSSSNSNSSISRTSLTWCSTRGSSGTGSRSGSESGNTDTGTAIENPYVHRDTCVRGTRPPPPPPHGHGASDSLLNVFRSASFSDVLGTPNNPAETVACDSQERHDELPSSNQLRRQGTQHPAAAASSRSSRQSQSSSSTTNNPKLRNTTGVDRSSSSTARLKHEDGATRLCTQPHDAAAPAAGAAARPSFNRQKQQQQGFQQQRDALQHEHEKRYLDPLQQLQRQLELLKRQTQQQLSRQQQELSQEELQQQQLRQHEVPEQRQAQQQPQLPPQREIQVEALEQELQGFHRERGQARQQEQRENLLLPGPKQRPQASLQQQHQPNQQFEHRRPQAQKQPLPISVGCKREGTHMAAAAKAVAAHVETNSCSSQGQQQAALPAACPARGSSGALLRQPLPMQREPRHPEQSNPLQEQEAYKARLHKQPGVLSKDVEEQHKEQQGERQHQQQWHRQRQQQKQEQSDQPQQEAQQQPEDLHQRRPSPPPQEEQQQMQQETRDKKRRLANQQKLQHGILEPAHQLRQPQQKQSGFKGAAPEATRDQQQPLQETLQRQQHPEQLWRPQHTTPQLSLQQSLLQPPQHLQHHELQGLVQPQRPAPSKSSRALRTIEGRTPSAKRVVAAATKAAALTIQEVYGCCNHLFLPAANDLGLPAADAFYQYEARTPIVGGRAACGTAVATGVSYDGPAGAALGASAEARIDTRERQEQQPPSAQLTDVKQEKQQRQRLGENASVPLQHGRPVKAALRDHWKVSNIAAEPGLTAAAKESAAATTNAAAAAATIVAGAAGAADDTASRTTASSGPKHQTTVCRRSRPCMLDHKLVAPNHQQQLPYQRQTPQGHQQLDEQHESRQQQYLQDRQRQQQQHLAKEQQHARLLQQVQHQQQQADLLERLRLLQHQQQQADLLERLRLLKNDEERDARLQRVEACKQPRQHQRLLLLLQQKALRLQRERAEVLEEVQQLADACQQEHRVLSVQSYEEQQARPVASTPRLHSAGGR